MKLFSQKYFFSVLLCTFVGASLSVAESTPVFSAERSRNLKTLETTPLLFEYHRLTTTDAKQIFYYPRRDSSWRKNYQQNEKDVVQWAGIHFCMFIPQF